MPQVAAGGKITVPDDYATIQAAADAAAPGTKILVKDGTYEEGVTVTTNNLTITAAHTGQVHIIGGFEVGPDVIKGKIEGFDITGNVDSYGGVFLLGCTKAEVKENEVTGGFGIILIESVGCVVKDNEVHDNTIGILGPGVGISIFSGGKHLIKGNEAHTNILGILVYGGLTGESTPGKNVISSNECTGNFAGIALFGSHENDLGENDCNSNLKVGIALIESDRNKIGSDNEANGNTVVGLILEASDDNTVKKNEAHGNGTCDAVDLGAGNTFIENEFGSFNCP